MRRVVCEAIGDFDQLKVVDEESPAPGPGQVLVDVKAAGVNFVDGLFVQGPALATNTPADAIARGQRS